MEAFSFVTLRLTTITTGLGQTFSLLCLARHNSPSSSLPFSPTPRLLETSKLAATPLPQPLQRQPHLRQLRLQVRTRLVIRPLIQLLINLALDFARAICRVLTQRLRHEFHIERCLHESGKRIPLALLDGLQKLA